MSGSLFPTSLYSKLDQSQAIHSHLVLVTVGILVGLVMLEAPYIIANVVILHKSLNSYFCARFYPGEVQ